LVFSYYEMEMNSFIWFFYKGNLSVESANKKA
jgi:hypothetical protein